MPRGLNIYDDALLQKRLWQPDAIASALWLDAADLSTISGSAAPGVSLWRDKSGNGRNASQATAANQPTFIPNVASLNGRPAIDWDTTSKEMFTNIQSVLNNNDSYSFTIAFRLDKYSNSPLLVHEPVDGSGGYRFLIELNASGGWVGTGGTQAIAFNTPTWSTTLPNIISLVRTGSTNGIAVANGTQVLSSAAFTASAPCTNNLNIGGYASRSFTADGMIAEIFVTSSLLSSIDRQKLEGYLAWKWGAPSILPALHPFIRRPPLIGD